MSRRSMVRADTSASSSLRFSCGEWIDVRCAHDGRVERLVGAARSSAARLVVDRVVLRVMADPMAHGAEVAGYALRYVGVIPAVAMQCHDRPTLLD